MKKTNKRPVKKTTGKKIAIIVASILAVALVGFSCYWVVKNWNSVKAFFAGTQIYTATDIETAYQDGYTNALADVTEYEDLIADYREEISTQLDEIAEKQAQITLLLASNQDYSDEIEELNTQIETLTASITNLQNQVLYYQNLIDATLYEDKYIVTYYLLNQVYEVALVQRGSSLSEMPEPTSENFQFNSWLNASETVVEVGFVPTANTSLYADITLKYLVEFTVNNIITSSVRVLSGETATEPAEPSKEGYTFLGWFVENVEYNFESEVTEDITLTAQFERVLNTVTVNTVAELATAIADESIDIIIINADMTLGFANFENGVTVNQKVIINSTVAIERNFNFEGEVVLSEDAAVHILFNTTNFNGNVSLYELTQIEKAPFTSVNYNAEVIILN